MAAPAGDAGGDVAQAGVGGLHLAAGDAVGDRAHPGAAVPGQVHAQQAELAELRGKLAGERSGLEPVGDVRHDPLGGERPHGVTDQALLRGQLVVDPEQVDARAVGAWRHGPVLSSCLAVRVCARCAAVVARS